MAKNHRSATLPPNLRHNPPPSADEGDNFFTKLKKRFKFKKGKYSVDVNTGDCENVSTVSFKKRESKDISENESPWKLGDHAISERETRSESPKSSKPASRTQSDRYLPGQILPKTKRDRKISAPDHHDLKPTPEVSNLNFDGKILTTNNTQIRTDTSTGNEYSFMKFEKEDTTVNVVSTSKVLNLENEANVKNEFVVNDDSAIDLDHFELSPEALKKGGSHQPAARSKSNNISGNNEQAKIITQESFEFEPGYESVQDVQRKLRELNSPTSQSHLSSDFDPNYESVTDVQRKIHNQFPDIGEHVPSKDNFPGKRNQSVESLDDPRYQSMNEVRKQINDNLTDNETRKPAKTYNVSKSIESLDEPGYESLNDVKRKVKEQDISKKSDKNDSVLQKLVIGTGKEFDSFKTKSSVSDMNDSALSMSLYNDSLNSSTISKQMTNSGSTIADGLAMMHESSKSKDSGFESKTDKSPDTEVEDELYSKVKKKDKTNQEEVYSKVNKTKDEKTKYKSLEKDKRKKSKDNKKSKNLEELWANVNKSDKNKKASEIGNKDLGKEATKAGNTSDNKEVNNDTTAVVTAADLEKLEDSDTELHLDPGYAECADAIKGFIPYGVYSDGSAGGSKISSCNSLNLSVEDFTLEPGYAECADAIKTGAIKKISVSHERLVEAASLRRKSKEEVNLPLEPSEYANPQVLFRKRSKLIEDRNSGDFSYSTSSIGPCSADMDFIGSLESLGSNTSLKSSKSSSKDLERDNKEKETKEVEDSPPVAPPLPARNYSLYLESDEAADIAPSPVDFNDSDDAFEHTVVKSEITTSISEITTGKSEITTGKSEITTGKSEITISETGTSQNLIGAFEHSVTKSETVTESSCENLIDAFVESKAKNDNNVMVTHICDSVKLNTDDVSSERDAKESLNANQKSLNNETTVNNNQGMSQSLEATANASNTMVEGRDNQSLELTVKYKNGNEKVLKIVEKEESPEYKVKRKMSKTLIDYEKTENNASIQLLESELNIKDSCDKCEGLETKESDNLKFVKKISYCDTQSVSSTNEPQCDNQDLIDTTGACLINNTGIEDNKAYQTESEPIVTVGSHEPVDIHMDTIKNTQNENSNESKTVSINIEHVDEAIKTNEGCDIDAEIKDSLQCNKGAIGYEFNSYNQESHGNYLDCYAGASFIKMQSVSTLDSDSDDLNENLPKLEIIESDWENAFENSSEEKDNEFESEVQIRSERSNTTTEDLSVCESSQITELFRAVQSLNDDLDGSNEAQALDPVARRATLEARLCVIDLTVDKDSDNVSKIMDGNLLTLDRDTEEAERLTDDTGVDSDLDEDNLNDIEENGETGCENCGISEAASGISNDNTQVGADHVKDGVKTGFKQLEVLTDFTPGLYQDTEPTHMSLNEVMGMTSPSIEGFRISTELDDSVFSSRPTSSVESANSCKTSNIPEETLSISSILSKTDLESVSSSINAPPPIPPHINSNSQSNGRTSDSSQSDRSNVDTPPDEDPPPPLFAYRTGSGPSEEDAPPAIPPRARIKKQSKRVSTSQDFMESMRQLKDCGWYWGPLSWEEAEVKLSNKPEGTFLVRDSSDDRYILSLSFKNQGRVHHTRIEHHKGHFSFWSQPDSHGKSTIKDFIDQCVDNSRNGRFLYFIRPSGPGSPPMPIHLLHPVSRFIQMRSLQHMCRFRILQMVRRDHIDNLPVPNMIKQYLQEAQYYVEYLDD